MKKITFLLLFIPFLSFSQFPGDNVFNTNQILRVDITFNQTGFWDSLVANYPSATDMMAIGLQITDNQGVHVMDSVAIRLKGNSSYGHPGNKKSFKIDINQYSVGQNYDGLKKLNFNNGFKDPTFIREKIFFDLSNSLGIPAPRVNFANVYMNGTFWGFYTIVEQVDDQFLEWATIDKTGNLFKAGDNSNGQTPADLVYYGQTATSYYSRYELKTNETLNDWSDLVSLINYINNSSDADFETNFTTNFNKSTLLQSLALDNMFSSLDSYLNSARNYYLYHNMTTNAWEWIKWDGNEAFGMYSGMGAGNLTQLAPNYAGSSRPLLTRIFANTNLYQEYKDYMCSMLDSRFNSTYVDAKIDELKTLIEADVTADNLKMYTTQNFIDNMENSITVSGGPMGSQTIFGLKSFVSDRNTYLTGVLSCPLGIHDIEYSKTQVYPNPFEVSFQLSTKAEAISIYDLSGKKVDFIQEVIGNEKQKITLKGKAGYYFLNFTQAKQNKTVQLVKLTND